jgi:hypothetical protein
MFDKGNIIVAMVANNSSNNKNRAHWITHRTTALFFTFFKLVAPH